MPRRMMTTVLPLPELGGTSYNVSPIREPRARPLSLSKRVEGLPLGPRRECAAAQNVMLTAGDPFLGNPSVCIGSSAFH